MALNGTALLVSHSPNVASDPAILIVSPKVVVTISLKVTAMFVGRTQDVDVPVEAVDVDVDVVDVKGGMVAVIVLEIEVWEVGKMVLVAAE